MPVFAAATPKDCFELTFTACKIALEHMTPVMLLTDGYIANGSEPWRYPESKDLEKIKPPFIKHKQGEDNFQLPITTMAKSRLPQVSLHLFILRYQGWRRRFRHWN